MSKYISGLIDRFKYIANSIEQFNKNSEDIFIKVGGKLNQFLSGSQELSKMSSETAFLFSTEIIDKGISEMTFLFNNLKEHFSASSVEIEAGRQQFLNILLQLELITGELSGFNKIVKRLKMLGISTKIESSRLGSDDNGFFLLAEQVDKLSGQIKDKAAVISDQSSRLLTEVNKTVKHFDHFQKDQNIQSDNILNGINHSLNTLSNQTREHMTGMEKLSSSTEEIRNNISGIVVSIQFHDITRQQMEHVKEALLDAAAELKKIVENSEEEKVNLISDICELQLIQFTNSMNDFNNAAAKITAGLKNVESVAGAVMNTSLKLLSSKDSTAESSYGIIENEISIIADRLNKNITMERELSESVTPVTKTLHALADHLTGIEDAGTEIEIISLNARVKAAHIGSNGLSLGVLAEAIQNISLESKSQTESAALIIRNITSLSDSLNVESHSQQISSTDESISKLLKRMKSFQSASQNMIEKLNTKAYNLNKDLSECIEGLLSFNKSNQMNSIYSELSDLAGTMRMNYGLAGSKITSAENLNKRYTMHSERQIHQSYIDKKISDTPSFDGDHFDNNIDLF